MHLELEEYFLLGVLEPSPHLAINSVPELKLTLQLDAGVLSKRKGSRYENRRNLVNTTFLVRATLKYFYVLALNPMVLLSDTHLLRMIKANQLVVDPFDEEMLHSAYIELRLGNKFTALMPERKGYLDPESRGTPLKQREMLETEPPITYRQKYSVINVQDDGKFIVEPSEYILGRTKEFIAIPDGYIGVLSGKSSLARLGIHVFCSGRYVDPKFKGHLILEIFNANKVPVALHPGIAIAKLSIQPLSKPPVKEDKVDKIFDKEDMETLAKWAEEKITEE